MNPSEPKVSAMLTRLEQIAKQYPLIDGKDVKFLIKELRNALVTQAIAVEALEKIAREPVPESHKEHAEIYYEVLAGNALAEIAKLEKNE